MRWSIAVALCGLCTISFAAEPARASIRKDAKIPTEELGPALQTLAKDYDFQVLYRTEIVRDLKTHGAIGSLTSDEALTKVLSGTGLTYKYLDSQTVTIVPTTVTETTDGAGQNHTDGQERPREAGKKSSQDFLVAQVGEAPSESSALGQDQEGKDRKPEHDQAVSDSDTIKEVVVTAEHVQEKAQETPISMSVYESAALKRNAITDIGALTAMAPDVNFANVQGESLITIRGISSRDTTENGDPAVTINVDGFYLNRPYSLDAVMYDLDRVEVLRGPQGTLNGRNSVGGAINIVTAQPSTEFSAYTSLAYGNFNALNLQGMVNIPVSDAVQMRASFLVVNHDGYRNNAPQPDGDAADDQSARLEVAFEPFDDFRGLVTAQYTKEGGTGDVIENIPFVYTSTGALLHDLPAGINSETFSISTPPSLDLAEKTVRFNFSYDLYGVRLTALGGYDELIWLHSSDDSNPLKTPYVYAYRQSEYPNTINAEFRASSAGDGPLQWQVGAFIFRERSHHVSADAAPLTNGTYNEYYGYAYANKTTSDAGYAQTSYQVTDALKLTAGTRYTSDYKAEWGHYGNLGTGAVHDKSGDASSSKPTYHVALDYDVTALNMLYAKFDTGYKAGGFNFGGAAYQPETITAYEMGSKNLFLHSTLQLNLAIFYYNDTDQQVSTYAYFPGGAPAALTQNAGKSRLYGADVDLIDRIPRIGTLNATVNYLHARYTEFLSVADPSDSTASGNVQLAGNVPPQAPTWSAQLGLEHDWAVPGGTVTGRIQSKLQSSSYFSFYNFADTRQHDYTMSDAFLTYAPNAAHWKVTAYVKNFEDSAVFTNAEQNQYGYSYSYQFYPPRTYGLRLETSW